MHRPQMRARIRDRDSWALEHVFLVVLCWQLVMFYELGTFMSWVVT